MDYTEGTEFAKIQWDQTRAPGLVIGLFQKDESGMSIKYVVKDLQNTSNRLSSEGGCTTIGIGNPFNNGDAETILIFLKNLSEAYINGNTYSIKNVKSLTGEIQSTYSTKTSNSVYCINKMSVDKTDNAKQTIDIFNRQITGTDMQAKIIIDNSLVFTVNEENKKSLEIAKYIDDLYFAQYDNLYFNTNYKGGFVVNTLGMNENQINAIKFFINNEDGDKFVKQFAKKGDVVFGKEYTKDGKFYDEYKIGLIIESSDKSSGSYTSVERLGDKYKYKHFTVKLATEGFGLNIPKYDVLEALLHECFMHGYSLIKDYKNNLKIDYEYISDETKKSKSVFTDDDISMAHYDHIEITNKIFKQYYGKKFDDIPDNDTYIWPKKAFKVLKEYVNGNLPDFKIQSSMFDFSGSIVGIDEKTGIIGNAKKKE